MIPTLISTATETDVVSIDITSGIDSTYDHYMFVCTDINPATDGQNFAFQVNAAGASGFNETMTTTFWKSKHRTDDTTYFAYTTSQDQAQGTAYQNLVLTTGSGTEESLAGILHLFSPSNTTYVTHFYSRFTNNESSDYIEDTFVAGYINTTAAIDEISFKNSSGNMDGVIQMYGIE
tara:strand:+ start:780 stop:1310 length:531 start_codon:yes stop_codon:yes gene_type:complete